ncbi:copper amine oxidase N-terminal domain-containing protein [Paenibacillus sp. sptzw28]|uniref:copper amine oxidase N-terminal domain-containing protein n=1 Tax=Paenibacillus sp. sptzw28 TaxID=715179 RepID=UPI001C6E0D0D|nr:copper amine oxidase N-terminal domain-containing protein [Paenibacillus sp. sptzw28]QYR22101.1 copper amine oxidase N-terminal domain-containing protein [Paenibacillus sp. sptzw28]
MKSKIAVLTAVVAVSMMTGTAFAAQGGNKEHKEKPGRTVSESVYWKDDTTVTGSVYDDKSVTGSVYGHNGAHGLINAYENVKDKPAGERIALLLKTKYNIEVNADTDLKALADSLAKQGKVEAAAVIQAAVVQSDVTNIEQYKKLSKLKAKLGQKGIKTYVNGVAAKFDVPPVVKEGRTLVPFRAIAESLKAEVVWEASTKTVIVKRDGVEVKLVLGSKVAYIGGKQVALDVAGQMKNNRVIVPMRFLGESLKSKVVWDAETSSVIILDQTK